MLKNCPLCGAKAELDGHLKLAKQIHEKWGSFVKCVGCGLRTDFYHSTKAAIARWNTRRG